ncbi:MAG: chloramphenicol acetyltransferase [Magnetovibrionaceae bacterium]
MTASLAERPETDRDTGTSPKQLSKQPVVHSTAVVTQSELGKWVEIGARTKITESSFGDYAYIMEDGDVIYADVGRFCSIASRVRLNPGNHPLERPALHHFTYRARQFSLGEDDPDFFDWRRGHKVTLGADVWVGHGATVLPGVTVGTGAAIGAGTIVTKDVAPFSVVAGNPGRPIRKRFTDRQIDQLLEIAWWDWSHERLRRDLADFRSLGIDGFIEKHLASTTTPGPDPRPTSTPTPMNG